MKHYDKELLLKLLRQRTEAYRGMDLNHNLMQYTDQDVDIDYEVIHFLRNLDDE